MADVLYYAYDGDIDRVEDYVELDEFATDLLGKDFVDWEEIAISTDLYALDVLATKSEYRVQVWADSVVRAGPLWEWEQTRSYSPDKLPDKWPIERVLKLIPQGCCVYYHGADWDEDNVNEDEDD